MYYPAIKKMMEDPMDMFDRLGWGITEPFFEKSFAGFGTKVDLYRKDGKIFVEAELPGISPENVDLHVYSDRLTLSAEKKSEAKEEDKDKNYFRNERSWGKIERVISFPAEADPETAKANFKNGVLTVEIQEKGQEKAHKKVNITEN